MIDFFKDGVVASMKTTKVKDVNTWLSNSTDVGRKNQKHILGLMEGLQRNKFYQTNKLSGKELKNINSVELHIMVPNLNDINQSTWNQKIKEIAKLQGFSDEIIKKLKIEFSTVEQYIKI